MTFLSPDWPAPSSIRAVYTTRIGGVSSTPFYEFNLGAHVGDNIEAVIQNREILSQHIDVKNQVMWLSQSHSNRAVKWQKSNAGLNADASYSDKTHQVCAVMTADCLPILFCNTKGTWVAACHAGWRGLANDVIENTISNYRGVYSDLIAWIGPSISQERFEVGEDVKTVFTEKRKSNGEFFGLNTARKYQFDIVGLAIEKMTSFGIKVFGGNQCTFSDSQNYYSYRRDGETGRQASLIWINCDDD